MKRPREDRDEEIVLNVKQVSDEDFRRWGVDETVSYLQRAGLGEWEHIFKGAFLVQLGKLHSL